MHKWAKQPKHLNSPDEFMQVMFALSRASSEDTPLQAYMAISELDSRRPPNRRLTPATVRLLARHFDDYSDQYRVFAEFPELTDESITLFMEVAQRLNNGPWRFAPMHSVSSRLRLESGRSLPDRNRFPMSI